MYEAYFQLQKRPFSTTPDPTCFFAPEPIREVFDELVVRAANGQGIGILTAAAGTGKTLVCRRIAADLAGQFTPLFLANANFPTRRALLQSLLFEMNKRFRGLEEQELRLAVYSSLRELTLAGRGAVLIIDEAHLMSERLLEELRLLATLAEGDEPLVRLILAGQMSLEERLAEPALAALNERITCHAYLEPLTRAESIGYIDFRIRWAGGDSSRIFTPSALEQIAAACNGLPRCLNQLCDQALLLTCVYERSRVGEDVVSEALGDLRQLPLHWNTPATGDIAVENVDNELAFDGEDFAQDRMEMAPPDSSSASANVSPGETVCFEVGGTESASGAMSVSARKMQIPSRVAASPDRFLPTRFAEEMIDDRYAALDVRAPRFLRTFEDAPVPENWSSPGFTTVPPAPRAPGEQSRSPFEGEGSIGGIQDSLPAVDAAPGDDPLFGISENPSEYISFTDLDAAPVLADDGDDRLPIDERLGASILETCREVQSAVGRWHKSDGDLNTIDPAHGLLSDDDLVLPAPPSEYDVIEPDEARMVGDNSHGRRDGEHPSRSIGGRYVPKPKYQHVFSTLRRRLGLVRRDA